LDFSPFQHEPSEFAARIGTISQLAGLREFAPALTRKRVASRNLNPNEENAMKKIAPYLASATLGLTLIASNPAAAQVLGFGIDAGYPAYPAYYSRVYGYPYGYASYPYGYASYRYYRAYSNPYAYNAWDWGAPIAGVASLAAAPVELAGAAVAAPLAVAANTAAPLITGRSVATGQTGNFCTTSVKTCELRHASYIGNGCSCRVIGGRARGTVAP
jgi:hypothetical protein